MQKLKKIFSRQNGLVLLLVLVEFMVLALRFVGDFRTGGVIDITPDLIIPYAEECTNDELGGRSEELKHAAKPAAKFDRVSREKRLKRAAAKST